MDFSTSFQSFCSVMFLFAWLANGHSDPGTFNVMDFGAVADGKKDNAEAFLSTWKQACASNGKGRIIIPQGTYLNGPMKLEGPCKGNIALNLKGIMKAPIDLVSDSWITFQHVNGLKIIGHGAFDGQGTLAWSRVNRSTSDNKSKQRPISLRFNFVTNATIRGISSIDSKNFHINVLGCKNVKFESIKISAPFDSPNTDGIHIGRSSHIKIERSVIGTGDDCVSLGDGSKNISVSGVVCGPGHGISIGSLGKYENEEPVSDIEVRNCTFTNTDNGVRIKTWPASHNGIASNFKFEDILMNNVRNPIVIDQQYCPYNACNLKLPSLVKVRNVIFKNIRGTSTSKLVVNLLCSKGVPCQGVELHDIDLKYTGNDGPPMSTCLNAKVVLSGSIFPPTCV